MENVVRLNSSSVVNGVMSNDVQLQMLNTRNLTSGAAYQRPINTRKIEYIISNFNIHKVNPIKVSFREGKYWVFDGQHTIVVLKAKNNGEDCMVRCEVHFNLTYEDEARLFAEQYDGSTKVDKVYQMKALAEAKNEETLKLIEITESVGLKLNFDKCKGVDKIVAVKKIQDIYRTIGEDGLRKTLYLIKQTWNGEPASLDKEVLGGVSMFYKTYRNNFDENTFIKQLSKIVPFEIKRKGNTDMSVKGDVKYARQVWDIYNNSLRKVNRLEYLFKG